MDKTRLEAFSDGVLAIIITIMILEIKVPTGGTFAALLPLAPKVLSYILSFIYVGIYWSNHHNLLHGATKVNGTILWSNLHLLFWLSLIPVSTGWMGEHNFSQASMILYGLILILSGIAYFILQNAIIKFEGPDSKIKKVIGKDYKAKSSILLYAIGIISSFYTEWVAGLTYLAVAIIWLIPDRRIENIVTEN